MKQYTIIIFLNIICFWGCNNNKKNNISNDEIRTELKQLLRRGYGIEELYLRTNCPEDVIYGGLNGDSIPIEFHSIIDSIYQLDKDEKIISASKIGFSAKECIQKIFVKSQNLPITSQVTNISVLSICDELINKNPFSREDSLKAIIAYVDNIYGFTQIPTNINVASYFSDYYNEHSLKSIKLPIDYSRRFTDVNSERMALLDYFVKQAEGFELDANKNLERNIDTIIDSYVDDLVNGFIENEVRSKLNSVKVCLKSKDEKATFYLDLLNKRISEINVDSIIQSEINNYCISVNCSRELAVNEIIGYRENVDNSDIVSDVQLDKYLTYAKGLDNAIDEEWRTITNTACTIGSIGGFFVPGGGQSKFLVSIAKNCIKAISLYKNAINTKLSEENLNSHVEELNRYLRTIIRQKIEKDLKGDPDKYYKNALDNNTKTFFKMLRNDFKIGYSSTSTRIEQ